MSFNAMHTVFRLLIYSDLHMHSKQVAGEPSGADTEVKKGHKRNIKHSSSEQKQDYIPASV